jgi:sugar phosphate isomerase/epimerase
MEVPPLFDTWGKWAMPRLSMNELTTFRWSFDEDVFQYQEAGYQAIGLWRRKVADFGEERALDLLAESGMAVSTVFYAGGFTGSDGRSLAESIDDAVDALRLAAAADAGSLILFTGGRNNHIQRQAERLLHSALDELLPMAEVFGVPLSLKPKHAACAAEWSFLTDLSETLAFVQQYESPWLKVVYDTYQFPCAVKSPELLAELIPYLGLVQVADGRVPRSVDQAQCLLGEGRIAIEPIVSALLDAGYDGDFDVKLCGPEIESASYYEILQRSQQTMSECLSTMARMG